MLMLPLLGGLIGAGASLIGSSMASSASKKGAKIAARSAQRMNRKNLAWQKRFAKNAVRWRVRDSRKAGIHPLAGLGAQVPGFSPSFEAGNQGEIIAQGGAAAGGMVAQAGQDIARGVSAMGDMDQKMAAMQFRMMDLQIKEQELRNASLASNVALQTQPGTPPAYPSSSARYGLPGQPPTLQGPLVVDVPLERVATRPGAREVEPGAVPEIGLLQGKDGIAPALSLDAKQRLEEDLIGTLQWNIRNRLLPLFDPDQRPSGVPITAPFNPITGVYGDIPKIPRRRFEDSGDMSDAFRY